MTAQAVLEALRQVWNALEGQGRSMAVIGGVALSRWKLFRATRDVDLLIGVASIDTQPLISALTAIGAKQKRPVAPLGNAYIVQLAIEPEDTFVEVQVDLLLADSDYHRQALSRRVPLELEGTTLYVLTCEDLILHKLIAGRMIDLADASQLLELNAKEIDHAYLAGWIERLQLESEWKSIQPAV
jgi:hypothetical protein